MTRLRYQATREDERWLAQAALAWETGDQVGLQVVLDEVSTDAGGVNRFIFALLSYANLLGRAVSGEELADDLRGTLMDIAHSGASDGDV